MKILKSLSLILITSSLSHAQSTMCFKENHKSMSTIENTKLSGGECKDLYSLSEMKKAGWEVKDIKVTPKNDTYSFIYILNKKENNSLDKNLKDEIIQELKNEEKEKELIKEKNLAIKSYDDGMKIYKNNCASCHGVKGEKKVFGSDIALKDMTLDDIKYAIRSYTIDDKDYGYGSQYIMKGYASSTTTNEIKDIYNYLQNLNKN